MSRSGMSRGWQSWRLNTSSRPLESRKVSQKVRMEESGFEERHWDHYQIVHPKYKDYLNLRSMVMGHKWSRNETIVDLLPHARGKASALLTEWER